MTPAFVAGEVAVRIAHPRQIGAAVLLVHGGRDYIITTQDDSVAGPAPEYDEFLRQFRFLGRSSNGS